jgi:predicted transcriptional regulator
MPDDPEGDAIIALRRLAGTDTKLRILIYLARKGPTKLAKIAKDLRLNYDRCSMSLFGLKKLGIVRSRWADEPRTLKRVYELVPHNGCAITVMRFCKKYLPR